MKKSRLIAAFFALVFNCPAQEQESKQNRTNELSDEAVPFEMLKSYEAPEVKAVPATFYDFMIRISSAPASAISDIKITASPQNYVISKENGEALISFNLLYSQSFQISYKKNGSTSRHNWDHVPAGYSMLEKFKKELTALGFDVKFIVDPKLRFCVTANSCVDLVISYEFCLNPDALQFEQKSQKYRACIDNDGVVSLLPFFESLGPSIDSNIPDNDPLRPYLLYAAFKLKLTNDFGCGQGKCRTYFEAEKLITAFLKKRITGTTVVNNIVATIDPGERFSQVIVHYKGRQFAFPYSKKTLDAFFSDQVVLRTIHLRKRKINVFVDSPCEASKSKCPTEKRFRINHRYTPALPTLTPGDNIYIK